MNEEDAKLLLGLITKKESREARFRRLNNVKTWGFDANLQEREELAAMVLKTGLTRKHAVLAGLRKYVKNMNKEESK